MFKCISVSTCLFDTFGVLDAWARKIVCANLNLISKTKSMIIPILLEAEMQVTLKLVEGTFLYIQPAKIYIQKGI